MAGDETPPAAEPLGERAQIPARGIRGEDLGRILSLSDGVFAFALTLLALSLVVPVFTTNGLTNAQTSSTLAFYLQQDGNAFLGYAFAFVMIGTWWVAHNRTFQYIARYDSPLIWINLAVLLQIAVMPFVLGVYIHYPATQVSVDLFAGIQVGLGITITAMWDYARWAKLIKPHVPEAVMSFFSRRGWLISAVFIASIGLSFLNLTVAEVSWAATFVIPRLLDRYRG